MDITPLNQVTCQHWKKAMSPKLTLSPKVTILIRKQREQKSSSTNLWVFMWVLFCSAHKQKYLRDRYTWLCQQIQLGTCSLLLAELVWNTSLLSGKALNDWRGEDGICSCCRMGLSCGLWSHRCCSLPSWPHQADIPWTSTLPSESCYTPLHQRFCS